MGTNLNHTNLGKHQAHQRGIVQPLLLTLVLGFTGCPNQDGSPNEFSFGNKSIGSLSGPEVCSDAVQITGINVPVTITPGPGAKYKLNGEGSTDAVKTLLNGQKIAICTNAPTTPSSRTVTLTIGDQTREFTVTVNPATSATFAPDQFSTPVDADPSISVSSTELTVGGLVSGVPANVQNGELFINGSKAVVGQTVKNGDKVQVRLTSSSTALASVKATLDVGGVKRDFVVKTKDVALAKPTFTPDQFPVPADAEPSTLVSSGKLTIGGLSAGSSVAASVNAGELLINDLKATTGQTVKNGDTVEIRLSSSPTAAASLSVTLTVAGEQRIFTVKTKALGTPQSPGSTEAYNPSTVIPAAGLEVSDATPACAADGSTDCLGDPSLQPGVISTVAFNVPKTGKVGKIALKLLIQHGHRPDLVVKLGHAGTTVTVYDLSSLRQSGGFPTVDGLGNDTGMSLIFDDAAKLPGGLTASTLELRCGQFDGRATTDPAYNKYAGNCWDNFGENTIDNPATGTPPVSPASGFGRYDRVTSSQLLSAFNDLDLTGDWTLTVQDLAPGNAGPTVPPIPPKLYKRPGNKGLIKVAQLLVTAK